MKHLLNNLSENEKNAIREQHEGGMRIDTSRFKTLLESTMGNVKTLISEDEPPTSPSLSKAPTSPPKKPSSATTPPTNQYVDTSNWHKVAAFSDPETTKVMTNILIDPSMIGLEGNTVKFTYRIAGKNVDGTGNFDCNSKNEMHFDGKPLTGTMYISDARVDVLKSKCGTAQGFASTNTGTNNNVA